MFPSRPRLPVSSPPESYRDGLPSLDALSTYHHPFRRPTCRRVTTHCVVPSMCAPPVFTRRNIICDSSKKAQRNVIVLCLFSERDFYSPEIEVPYENTIVTGSFRPACKISGSEELLIQNNPRPQILFAKISSLHNFYGVTRKISWRFLYTFSLLGLGNFWIAQSIHPDFHLYSYLNEKKTNLKDYE